MKGLLFNIVEEAVIDRWGEAAWDAVLDDAEVSGAYTSLGSYPDADLLAIVGVASRARGSPRRSHPPAGSSCVRRSRHVTPSSSTTSPTPRPARRPQRRRARRGAQALPDSIVPTSRCSTTPGPTAAGRPSDCATSRPWAVPAAEGLVLGAADHFGERLRSRRPAAATGDAECILEASPLAEGPS
jgi:hypothetical protein